MPFIKFLFIVQWVIDDGYPTCEIHEVSGTIMVKLPIGLMRTLHLSGYLDILFPLEVQNMFVLKKFKINLFLVINFLFHLFFLRRFFL